MGGNEGDYSEKIKAEGVSKWIYADADYQWEWGLFWGDTGSKVKTDWIKDGVGDSCDAAPNQLILFWSDIDFDRTESDEGKLPTLTSKMSSKQLHKKVKGTWETGQTVWQSCNAY